MKFTALSLAPGVLWTWLVMFATHGQVKSDAEAALGITLVPVWFITLAIITAYWISRAWRAGAGRSR